MEIKKATLADLEIIAECHLLCFPQTLSAKLGKKFVMKCLEPAITDENSFMLFIFENNECAGYVNGLIKKNLGSASTMLQSSLVEGFSAFAKKPWLIFDKELLNKRKLVIKNIKYKLFGVPKSNINIDRSDSVGLPGMCVHPGHRRKGYASSLMLAAEKYAYDLGFRKLHCSVLANNPNASNGHLKLGWVIDKNDGIALSMSKKLDY
jgi:GNAT superfamily N-acetyltransferase